MEQATQAKRNHSVNLDNRKKVTISGVEEVVSSNDSGVIVRTSQGVLTVSGSGLNITRLSIEDGILAAEGTIDSLRYSDGSKQKGFLKGMFK